MKTIALLSLVAMFAVAPGCASVSDRYVGRYAGPYADADIDHQKIYLVEQWAKRSGATVVWVNYPQRKASVAQ